MTAAVFIQSTNSIGFIVPDIVIEEIGTDRTVLSENPIEVGTPSCDHAYRRPAEILMRCGWSDATHQQNGYVQLIYATLIALKNSYQLINVMTFKRQYQNMLIESCILRNDATTEFALMVMVNCREIIITDTSNSQGSGISSATPADPSANGPVVNTATPSGIPEGTGDYSAPVFSQIGGLTNTTTPSLGSVPGNAFTGQFVPLSSYPANLTGAN